MFTVEERDAARERILALAGADERVVAAAEVGSLALGGGDEYSDLDLTFGVAEGASPEDVLEGFTRLMVDELDAAILFDLPYRALVYRVFLLPSSLQVDLSVAPAAAWGAHSPNFRLVFGEAVEQPPAEPLDIRDQFGWAVHDAVRARYCIERGLPWQAEFLIGEVKDKAFGIACVNRGVRAVYGKSIDELPDEVKQRFEPAIVRSLDRAELVRALGAAVEALLAEPGEAADLAAQVEPQLREAARAE
jgi:predicted nucleotidyltransferase